MSTSQHEGRALPKFGEWDVNDPASADGFTVIFSKARDEKKTGGVNSPKTSKGRRKSSSKRKWFCFSIQTSAA